ncbi:sperm flagellar protein 2 [Nilaparvata lugens]|uniref:sperm flagellar protein 2 n=1 Tax=Nilaparvata lugens TaxID=108931 RepID=UPI00193D6F6E|nr:sperm flagellar protein 2 [Nilaparvata lugens]
MKEILKNWLFNDGICVDIDNLGQLMRDGRLLLRILTDYKVVNPHFTVDFKPGDKKFDCVYNLRQVRVWLEVLGVNFDEDVIEKIADGCFSTCVAILTNLYSLLVIDGGLPVVDCEEKQAKLSKIVKNSRFLVTKVDERALGDRIRGRGGYDYNRRLLENADTIEWYNNKHPIERKRSPDVNMTDVERRQGIDNNDKLKNRKSLRSLKTKLPSVDAVTKCIEEFSNLRLEQSLSVDSLKLENENQCNKIEEKEKVTKKHMNKIGRKVCNIDKKLPPTNTESVDECIQEFTTLQFSKCSPVFEPPLEDSFFDYRDKSNFPHPPLEYIANIVFAQKKSVKDVKQLEEYERVVEADFWGRLRQEDVDFFDDHLSGMIFKLSRYEKMLFTKVYQILHQDQVQRTRLKCYPRKIDFGSDELREDKCSRYFTEGLGYYQSEKKRTNELHWRLYADNLKFWYEKLYTASLKTVECIVDIAVKKSEYQRQYKSGVKDCLMREWKSLFCQNQPIFKANELDTFDVMQEQSDVVDEVEEQTEWVRQDVISNQNMDDYLFLEGNWSLKNEDGTRLDLAPVTREDQQTLSYIVYKLLDVKYPYIQKIEPADLPLYPVRAIVVDFDESLLEKLRSLLHEQGVLLVDINSAINFCVEAFVDSEEELMHRFTPDRQSVDLRVASEKTVTILENTTCDGLDNDVCKRVIIRESSGVQTSLSHLDLREFKEDTNEAAFVGKKLLENMKTSSDIKVALIVDAIVAYVQSKKRETIKGWVIVNFPSTLLHASVLEYTLSANRFPYRLKETISDTSFGSSVSTKESSVTSRYDELKYSKLLLNPQNNTYGNSLFTTYFTSFVPMKKLRSFQGGKMAQHAKQSFKPSSLRQSDHINFDVLLQQPSNFGAPTLETFYRNENIRNEFFYNYLDLDTLNSLVQLLVTGMSSVDETVLSIIDGSDKQDKQSEDDSKSSRLAVKMSNTSQVYCDSMTALNSMNDSFLFDSNRPSSDLTPQYVDLLLQAGHAVSLAELWEMMTNTYLNTLHDSLYLMRVHERTVAPYFLMVRQAMESCFTKPDNRQELVTKLLNDYNSINLALLLEDDVILEAHRRTSVLERTLTELSDDKRRNALEVREKLIAQEWDRHHLSAMSEGFLVVLQAEATRFTRTLELLQDYYLLGLNVPLKLTNAVHPINVDNKDGSTEKLFLDGKVTFKSIIEEKVKYVLVNMFRAREACEAVMIATESQLLAEERKRLDNAVKEVRAMSAKDKRKSKTKKLDEDKMISDKTLELQMESEKNCQSIKKVFHEWLDALRVETKRAHFRVELLKVKAVNYILEFEKQFREIFSEFLEESERIHCEEAECVRKIRKLFGTAIEEKTHILAEVYYNHTDFYVRILTPEVEPDPEPLPPILEVDYESTELSLAQLEVLYLRFSMLAPDGLIPKQILIEFFKDVSRTAYRGTWFWDRLTTAKLNKMFNTLFGESEMCDWRDLIVISLEMDFPTAEDILDAKLQFAALDKNNLEVVSLDSFMETTLWFERELPKSPKHNLFLILVKRFLAKLFQNGDEQVNYSALLLAFCKDLDPIVGFGKALTYILGRCVIVYKQDEYLEQMYTDHIDTGRKITEMIVDEMVSDVVEAVEIEREFGNDLSLRFKDEDDEENRDKSNNNSDEYVLFETIYLPFFRRLKYCDWTTLVPLEIMTSYIKTLYSTSEFPEWMLFDFDKEIEPFLRVVESTEFVYVPDFVTYLFSKDDFPCSCFTVFRISELIVRFVIDDKIY